MTSIKIRTFNGINPLTDPELLSESGAQVAKDCRLISGDLKPRRGLSFVTSVVKMNPTTIYRFGQFNAGQDNFWLTFNSDVNLAKGAVNGDTTERTYYTGDGFPKVINTGLALTGGVNYPVSFMRMGVPRPIADIKLVANNGVEPESAPDETRTYVVTYVNSFGEEGAPSAASSLVTVRFGTSATVRLSNIPTAPEGGYNITAKRIYRSATTSTGSIFQFLAELPIETTTYTDTNLSPNLGEALATDEYDPPPDGMLGLTLMANGVMAGFQNLDLYFSPPFIPYAFPERYRLSLDSPVVGIAALGNGLFVGTKANPYIITGTDPESFLQIKLPMKQACVSKRSIVTMNGGAIYASPDGLYMAMENGLTPLTERIFTREQWQSYKPESIHAYEVNNEYVMFYDNGSKQGSLIFDFTGKQATLTESDYYTTAGYSDRFTDSLFTVDGNQIKRFDSGSLATFTWKSKKFRLPDYRCFAYGCIHAESYPVQFTLIADSQVLYDYTVTSPDIFRLPAGRRSQVFEIQVRASSAIKEISIAESAREMQAQ